MLKLPGVLGVAEARRDLSEILDRVERGEAFIIKGPKKSGALVLSVDAFRRFQDAYLELVGEIETHKILEDERAMRVLESDSGDRRHTISEIEKMLDEDAAGGS